ncbi:MAG: molybdate transporter, inner rane subunit [Chloroflexi bacterium]|nr:molybdate transporter, inner rane subunit [Chloroflexota bacterium]
MIRRIAVLGAAALLAVFLAGPVVNLVLRALEGGGLGRALGSATVRDALALSLGTTAVSLVIAIAIGTPLAYVLARRRSRWKGLLELVVDLPIVLPPSVAGLALLLVFGRRGALGDSLEASGLAVPFTTIAVVLAQVFVAAPLYVRSARAGIERVPRDLEDAARVDGATEFGVFRYVMVPLAAPALAAGLVLTWARALGEFGATILFAGNVVGRTQTLPLVVYAEFQAGDLEAAIAASVVLVLAAVVVLGGVRLARRGSLVDVSNGS